jgi:hypothetical protein
MNVFATLMNVKLGTVQLILAFFMLISAPLFFPTNPEKYQLIMLIYLMMTIFVVVHPKTRVSLHNTTFVSSIPKIGISFLLTFFVMSGIGFLFIHENYATTFLQVSFTMALFHSLYVSVAEEKFFRGFLNNTALGWLGSALVFAGFHYFVYDGDLIKMIIAFLMALGLTYIQNTFSPSDQTANIGAHAGFNTFVESLG